MYISVVPDIFPDVVPGTLISVGNVATFAPAPPTCPAGHARDTHAADEFDPAADNVPTLQFVQTLAPATDEYVPAGQFAQTVDEFAPVTAENVPAGQDVQVGS